MEKKSQLLIIASVIVGAVLIIVLALILTRNSDETTTETTDENNTAETQENENGEENGEDDDSLQQPSVDLSIEDITALELGLECAEQEDYTVTIEDLKTSFVLREDTVRDKFVDTYGAGNEGISNYHKRILQINSFRCDNADEISLIVILSDQLEEADFHELIDIAYLLGNHPAESECAEGTYQEAKFANAVITYTDSVQRSQTERGAHVNLLTQITDDLGGDLQDKCPPIAEEEAIKMGRQADISFLRAALATYSGNNNGKLPTTVNELLDHLKDRDLNYYNDGKLLTDEDVTTIGTAPLTQTSAQFLFGDYNQTALAEAGLPDADHFHLLFKTACPDGGELDDYSAIGTGNSRAYTIIYRLTEEDPALCIDNL